MKWTKKCHNAGFIYMYIITPCAFFVTNPKHLSHLDIFFISKYLNLRGN